MAKKGVDKFYQSIFRHLGVYESLFEIIQGDLEIREDQLKAPHHNLIDRIYIVLALGCRDYPPNKTHFQKYLKSHILPHLNKNSSAKGIGLFLFEFITDNPIVLEDKEVVTLTHAIANKIEKMSSSDPRKMLLMSTLIKLVILNGYLIEDNQNRVLSILILKVKKNILIKFNDANIPFLFDKEHS